jgi:hypothetical protein
MNLDFLTEANWPKIPTTGVTSQLSKDLHAWLGKLSKAVILLNERITILENDKTTLQNEVNEIKTKSQHNSKNNTSSWSDLVSNKKNKSNEQLNVLAAVSTEAKDQKNREKNVIIFGVKASSKVLSNDKKNDDKNEIDKILTAINCDKGSVKNFYRIKSIRQPAPLIITVDNPLIRNQVLKNAKTLATNDSYNGNHGPKVFINPDLTEVQRTAFKKLLSIKKEKNNNRTEEQKKQFYFGIRDDKILKIKINA